MIGRCVPVMASLARISSVATSPSLFSSTIRLLSSFADMLGLGECREWDCRFEAKEERYKFSQLSAIRFLDLHPNNRCRFVAHLSAKFLTIKCRSAGA